jgi:hypothetical protein
MAEQWLSISEYARTFGVSDMTVRRRVKTGRLHAVLKEGKYFIPVQMGDAKPAMPPPMPQSSKRAGEMQVIKGHPQAHKTFMANEPRHAPVPPVMREPEPQPPQVRADYLAQDDGESMIPASLRRPLLGSETSLVDTRALIAFCEATMRKVSEGERRTVEKFKSKLEALEATLVSKDMEIKALRQQVEDLQLLCKILEKKRTA